MEFFDKVAKKASETYKEAAQRTSKLAKETKLKMLINDDKSKINDLILLDKDYNINDVIANGQIMVKDKKILKKSRYINNY